MTSQARDMLLAHAAEAHPRECCGILVGRGKRILEAVPADNVHPRPATHFEIDAQALIDRHRAARGGGLDVLGYYHSHPQGSPRPSATDTAMAAFDGAIWAIVAKCDVTLWSAGEGGFVPLPYDVTGR